MTEDIEKAKQIAQILITEVSDIDIVLLYGGLALGRAHSRSDYDMLAICDNKEVKWEFTIKEKPICLWSMTWKDAEDIITGQNGILWSIGVNSLVNARIIHYRDDVILDKFNKLKSKVPEGGINALKQGIADFDSLYGQLWLLEKQVKEKNILEMRFIKWEIVIRLNCILSALNNIYFLNNWGGQFHEIQQFENLPVDYVSRIKKFLISKPKKAVKIAPKLIEEVKNLLKLWLKSKKDKIDFQEIASGWAGVIEYLNKSKSAEEKNNLYNGLYAACDNAEYYLWAFQKLQNEIWKKNSFYSIKDGLTNLTSKTIFHIKKLLQSQDLSELRHSTEQLSKQIEKEAQSRNLKLHIADSLDDGRKFIRVKTL